MTFRRRTPPVLVLLVLFVWLLVPPLTRPAANSPLDEDALAEIALPSLEACKEGRYDEAATGYRLVLEIMIEHGVRDKRLAEVTFVLGLIYANEFKWKEFSQVINRVVSILEFDDIASLHKTLEELVSYVGFIYRIDKAPEIRTQLIEKAELLDFLKFSNDFIRRDLIQLFEEDGKIHEAEKLIRDILEEERKIDGRIQNLGIWLGALARNLSIQEKHAAAEKVYRQIANLTEHAYEYDISPYVGALSDTAFSVEMQGHYEEAEALLRQALSILERKLGSDKLRYDLDYASSLVYLYFNLIKQNKKEEAEPLWVKATSIWREVIIFRRGRTLSLWSISRGKKFLEHRRFREAIIIREHILALLENDSGRDRDFIVNASENLADAYTAASRYVEAEEIYLKIIKDVEDKYNSQSTELFKPLRNYMGLLRSDQRHVEAKEVEERYKEIRHDNPVCQIII